MYRADARMAEAGSEFWANLLAGGCTGLFVDAVLFPLDVFKTRKQAETTSCRRQPPAPPSSQPHAAAPSVQAPQIHAERSPVPEAKTSRQHTSDYRHTSTYSVSSPSSGVGSSGKSAGAVSMEARERSGPSACSSVSRVDSGASALSPRIPSGKNKGSFGSAGAPVAAVSRASLPAPSPSGVRTALDGVTQVGNANRGMPGGQERFGFLGTIARRYYPGFGALAAGAFPSSALFFVTYEGSKQLLAQQEVGRQLSPAVTYGLCSTLAEFASCCVRTPFEMLKQQMQLGMHATTTRAIHAIWQRDGWRGFFVGFNATIVRDLPFVGVEMGLWEYLKKYFCSFPGVSESVVLTSFSSGFAGFLAGAGAAVATTPLDVVKTRLMTQQEGRYQYRGYFDCFSTILQREGYAALFRGLKIRVIWVALGGALFLGGYDGFKALYLRVLPGGLNESRCGACSAVKNGDGGASNNEPLNTDEKILVSTVAAETQE
ncbi:mitochondrial carrier superfamily protein [Toxoplasma gondii ME49]|uniref:Mitochondrial carrier domain-containing protein n=3 Tax=Toxoplasma gondii TaxID=5811 RepID=B6KFP5_TOXGV|nr:mitochondrial carrier superfamily protein [Toxoplasma gondii ME49]EPT30403.1 mitochondrial carrier superfamily protein [Toxoplasma gondii ME49]ESS31539.1 mitochondrial carrier superfamily protein [Toxoplasma gondii VEG]PIM02645.1 mitochondrial carrier superfamily protein [Toxoplasma gondii COUG]CEL73076.1 TPA: mitochondrial carrier domain-containing protein [Toxoplasma gondii VEG]|eukprot:XP_018637483.1 mitochondrial carrier superfamily protein [Toxoplasma gondii ME49]